MQGNSKQASFRGRIHWQIEGDIGDRTVNNTFDLAGGFLEDQQIIVLEKSHSCRLIKVGDNCAAAEVSVEQLRHVGLSIRELETHRQR